MKRDRKDLAETGEDGVAEERVWLEVILRVVVRALCGRPLSLCVCGLVGGSSRPGGQRARGQESGARTGWRGRGWQQSKRDCSGDRGRAQVEDIWGMGARAGAGAAVAWGVAPSTATRNRLRWTGGCGVACCGREVLDCDGRLDGAWTRSALRTAAVKRRKSGMLQRHRGTHAGRERDGGSAL